MSREVRFGSKIIVLFWRKNFFYFVSKTQVIVSLFYKNDVLLIYYIII